MSNPKKPDKSPREMAAMTVRTETRGLVEALQFAAPQSQLEQDIIQTVLENIYLAGFEAGARMAWDRIDDYLTGDMISFVRSFDEWWASLENK